MRSRLLISTVLLPALGLPLVGCGSEEAISIEGAWARPSAEGQTTGAVYFRITSADDDRLLAASVPAAVAARTEVHEVVMAQEEMSDMSEDDMSDMSEDDMSDMSEMSDMQMTMQELADGLPLPAGETVTLEPGGYHIMLLDIAAPLVVGDEIEVTLDLEMADDVTLTVEVAESAP